MQQVPCPGCGAKLAPSGSVTLPDGSERELYTCGQCTIAYAIGGAELETALTFTLNNEEEPAHVVNGSPIERARIKRVPAGQVRCVMCGKVHPAGEQCPGCLGAGLV